IDNGAGLQWSNLSLAAGGSTTISSFVSFGATAVVVPTPTPSGAPTATPTATPTPVAVPPPPPPAIPEADPLLLVGGGLSGLAGYVAFQLRHARPRRRRAEAGAGRPSPPDPC